MSERPPIDIVRAAHRDDMFKKWFAKSHGGLDDWHSWFSFLRVLFGLPTTDTDLELFRQCTGRQTPKVDGYRESWLVVGRRGGKSAILSLVAVYLGTFYDWSRYLQHGERGSILIIASDRKQGRVIFRYVRGLLTIVPHLQNMITRETADTIDLSNNISIEIMAGNYRSVRGYTVVASLADEIAFWRSDESANPDREVLNSLRPAMMTIP